LASGSRGNATVVEQGRTRLLVDCGLTAREAARRLQRRTGWAPEALSAILLTHEHGDHVRGAAVLARAYDIPVWMSAGTAAALGGHGIPQARLFQCGESFAIDDLAVQPYPVAHDALEPCQFVVGDGARRLGMLSDAGSLSPAVECALAGCDALLLECNYDEDMLARGPYPPVLKRRIAGPRGHLGNGQAAELLRRIDAARLQHVVAVHISAHNNTPRLACAAVGGALGCSPDWVGAASQEAGIGWRDIR
jgi:phosphoribosyl 1,2-cyclic phosphodiesterase